MSELTISEKIKCILIGRITKIVSNSQYQEIRLSTDVSYINNNRINYLPFCDDSIYYLEYDTLTNKVLFDSDMSKGLPIDLLSIEILDKILKQIDKDYNTITFKTNKTMRLTQKLKIELIQKINKAVSETETLEVKFKPRIQYNVSDTNMDILLNIYMNEESEVLLESLSCDDLKLEELDLYTLDAILFQVDSEYRLLCSKEN